MKNKAAAAEGVRILLIEDNAADVDLMKYALDAGHFPYELSTLTDGEEALAFIRREGKYADAMRQPALIVMDLHLPKHDGMEILQEIRRSEEFADLPVAVLSILVSPEEKTGLPRSGKPALSQSPETWTGSCNVGKKIRKLVLESKARGAGAVS